MPRRSWPSSWPTAPTSPPRSPTAVMSSTICSPSGTVPCWPSRRPASAPTTYWSPRTARSWAGSTCTASRMALLSSATGSRSTSQAAAWRPRPSGSCAVWRRRNTGCARSRRPPPARTPRHRRCWPGLGSSRSARQTRPTSAVSRAPGISVTWCSPSAVPYWFVVTPCRGHAAWARFCCRGPGLIEDAGNPQPGEPAPPLPHYAHAAAQVTVDLRVPGPPPRRPARSWPAAPAAAGALARTISGSHGSGGRASRQGRSRRARGFWIRIRFTVCHLLGRSLSESR